MSMPHICVWSLRMFFNMVIVYKGEFIAACTAIGKNNIDRAPTLWDFLEKSLLFKITFPGPGKVRECAKSKKLRENSENQTIIIIIKQLI